jgi:hypothetical protein
MEMYQSGEGADFVIEVQQQEQQKPNDDDPSKRCSKSKGSMRILEQALNGSGNVKERTEKSIQQQQKCDQSAYFSIYKQKLKKETHFL